MAAIGDNITGDPRTVDCVAAGEILQVLRECATEIAASIEGQPGRGLSGERPTQYHLDVAADAAALRVLHGAGYRVVSEESGATGDGDVTVVVDPIDGSTNCDRGVPFYATSLAALRGGELVAACVVNLATGASYEAERGAGAWRDGESIKTTDCTTVSSALVGFSGLPARHAGWSQFRALGAASLEICLVADGSLDLYAVAQRSSLAPWDYLGGLLVVLEAGGSASEYENRELVITESTSRRPVFAATKPLLDAAIGVGPL
jgi:fructose-1,6-bisphosphatase/inositol monophosphatase family enzyme